MEDCGGVFAGARVNGILDFRLPEFGRENVGAH